MILTDQEIKSIHGNGDATYSGDIAFARAIEAAVIARLATVSAEPCAWVDTDKGVIVGEPTLYPTGTHGEVALYPAEALAAVRVQERASTVADCYDLVVDYARDSDDKDALLGEIRALIGGKE